MAIGWRLHRHHRGPQFLIDTTNTGRILLPGQNRIPRLGHHWLLFHGHGQIRTIIGNYRGVVVWSYDQLMSLSSTAGSATGDAAALAELFNDQAKMLENAQS